MQEEEEEVQETHRWRHDSVGELCKGVILFQQRQSDCRKNLVLRDVSEIGTDDKVVSIYPRRSFHMYELARPTTTEVLR